MNASTTVVGAIPDTSTEENSSLGRFPTLFLTSPTQAQPNRQVQVEAIAPTARIEFNLPAASAQFGNEFVLARTTELGGEVRLSIVDRLELVDENGAQVLQTTGRELPGAASDGQYAAIASTSPLAFITGRITGPAATVSVDGSPFVFEATEPNAAFIVPVIAGGQFALSFVNPDTGDVIGTASGQAPVAGELDLGEPLGSDAGQLQVKAQPDANSLVDIGQSIVFDFSEPIDSRTLTATSILVTDSLGNRIFGTFSVSGDATRVAFTPNRRWKFGTTYRYGVSSALLAISGARLPQTFNSTFTTFSPDVLVSVDVGFGRDVAVSNGLALLGTDAGISLLDVAQPESPTLQDELLLDGGASGVSILSNAQFTDREGNIIIGTLGLVASGDEANGGELGIFDLNVPEDLLLLGSTQLTAAQSEVPPTGVLNMTGVPNAVALGPELQAVVAVKGVGVETVDISQSIPDDPLNPGAALGLRFPEAEFEGVNDVASLDGLLVAVGENGLTILDAETLELIGNASTEGDAQGVAAISGFSMDVNGDGAINLQTEVIDLAVVANGTDGLVQMFDITDPTSPMLISVVRLSDEASGVALDGARGLAYIGSGLSGVTIIDLSGPASVQPIDFDFDLTDDRVLGVANTPGSARRLALELSRGLAYVADGINGMAVLQITPPSADFDTVLRDPLLAAAEDEQSIEVSRQAFLSDDALQVTLNAVIPPQALLFLTIEELPSDGGAPVLAFPGGATSQRLFNGANALTINIEGVPTSQGSSASLSIRDGQGRTVSRFDFDIVRADISEATLESMFVAPESVITTPDSPTAQISVGGVFADGSIINISTLSFGTSYQVQNPQVATVDDNGLVTQVAGGTTAVIASNGDFTALTQIVVDAQPAITGIRVLNPLLTLTADGAQEQLIVVGLFSNEATGDVTLGFGTTYTTNDSGIVTVDDDGLLTATGEGTTTVVIANAPFEVEARVSVEFRVSPNVTAIDLNSFTELVTTDDGEAVAQAVISGTGSLEGLPVLFTLSNGAISEFSGVTDFGGAAFVTLTGLDTPGSFNVTASIVNPADSATLSDSEPLTVEAGSGDNEPNDDIASASRLDFDMTINATVNAATDPRDVYRIETTTDGSLNARLLLPDGATPANFALVVMSNGGGELGRFAPDDLESSFTQTIAAGTSFVAVEATVGDTSYELTASFDQATVEITNVNPASGGPGTQVTIEGSGFSIVASENIVLFGGIAGGVLSATTSGIQAVVPASAVDGPIEVIVGTEQATGPDFTTGNSDPPPSPSVTLFDETAIRLDPVGRVPIVVNRIWADFDPLVGRAEVDALTASLGGAVVGFLPTFNTYILEFSAIETIASLEAMRRQLEADPSVLATSRNPIIGTQTGGTVFDTRDKSGGWPEIPSIPQSIAYEQAKIFDALAAVRQTPPFDIASNLKDVTIAVIDTGFKPGLPAEFDNNIINFFAFGCGANNQCGFSLSNTFSDSDGHGTEVTSIIAARNNNSGMNGIVTGLFQPNESARDKVKILVYEAKGDAVRILVALADLRNRGTVDVVNLSIFPIVQPNSAEFRTCKNNYKRLFNLYPRTLFTIAAGNEDRSAGLDCVASLSTELSNVMSIGSVAVKNLDESGEGQDQRSKFSNLGVLTGSNFGRAVTMTAPGEEVLLITTDGFKALLDSNGTSYAAPMVAGVAAMLQAIRPVAKFTPRQLTEILVGTGDDIKDLWNQGLAVADQSSSMTRLNALNAVLSVLPPLDKHSIYVADQEASNGAGKPVGRVVAVIIDPLTGERIAPNVDRVIKLELPANNATFTKPTAVAVSPLGDKVYAVVESVQPALGDGLLVIDTQQLKAIDFIPLSGVAFPPPPSTPGQMSPTAPILRVTVGTNKPGMVFSKDGLLLYMATGKNITIVNLVERKIVRTLNDLPQRYKGTSTALQLLTRKIAITGAIDNGIAVEIGRRAGTIITDLTISPDGKILYVLVGSGGGGGDQPGFIIPVNVDLYTDRNLAKSGLQTDLKNYFKFALGNGATPVVLQMQGAGGRVGTRGDEPKAVAASPDGKHIYMVNGGVNFFQGVPPDKLDVTKFIALAGVMFASANATAIGGLVGLTIGLGALGTGLDALFDAVSADVNKALKGGRTLISAPGFTGVFSAKDKNIDDDNTQPAGTQEWMFPPNVVFGWSPDSSGGGLITDQFRNRALFAKRPFDMAIRPDGQRALLPMFQTGNICVLDLEGQKKFEQAPPSGSATTNKPANPTFALQPDDLFQGVVGCTRALEFDQNLWPDAGKVTLFKGQANNPIISRLNSPDEALWFPWDVEYAQNGRWAVYSHSGVRAPGTVSGQICDFENEVPGCRLPLLGIGFGFEGGSTTTLKGGVGTLDEGLTITSGQNATFRRFGGAISVVNDRAITKDFGGPNDANGRLKDNVTTGVLSGLARAYYSVFPICQSVIETPGGDPSAPFCTKDVVTNIYDYVAPQPAGEKQRFHRPRGVDIQPFVTFATPIFGDHAGSSQPVQIKWRDSRITKVGFAFYELDPNTKEFVFKGETPEINLSRQAKDKRTFKRTFGSLFRRATNGAATNRRVYKVEARICSPTETCKRPQPSHEEGSFSYSFVNVTFEGSPPVTATVCNPGITLRFRPFVDKDGDPSSIVFMVEDARINYTITLRPGESLISDIKLETFDPRLAVTSTHLGNDRDLSGSFRVKIVEPSGQTNKWVDGNFRMRLAFSTTRCSADDIKNIPSNTTTVRVKPNVTAAGDIITPKVFEFGFDDVCTALGQNVPGFARTLRDNTPLAEVLGFNPLISSTGFQMNPKIFILTRARGVQQVVASEAFIHFLSTVSGREGPNPEFFAKGVRPPPLPIFDASAGRITNEAQLTGRWEIFTVSIMDDRQTQGSNACPGSGLTAANNQFISDMVVVLALFGVDP